MKSPASVSLRRLLLTRVAMLVGAATTLVATGFVIFGLLPMAERIAEDQFDTATTRIENGLNAVFSPTTELLAMSRGWLAGEAPELESADAFNRLFQPVLESSPHITSVVAGTSTGQGWLLLQQPDGSWRNRMTDIPRWGDRHLFIDRLTDGRTLKYWETRNYDARKRPWFQIALAAGKENVDHWTSPYTFFTTGDPGITASTLIRLRDGREFVLGFDLMLRDLSRNTLRASVGQHGLALIITEDERVLGLPAAPSGIKESEWLKQILKPARELGLPPLTAALTAWNDGRRQARNVMSYYSDGSRWLASIRRHSLGQQQLWVLILAPEADFAPAWLSIISTLTAALMLVLGIALWIVRKETGRLTRPLEILAKVNDRIGQLQFQSGVPVKTRITEIQQLASAQEAMLEMLRNNQRDLAEQAENQGRQIAALRIAETRLTRQNSLLNAIIENFPGGISVFDADLRLAACNTQFKTLMELPESLFDDPHVPFETIVGYCARRGDYGAGEPQQQVAVVVDRVRNFQPHTTERVCPNGIALEVRGTPLPDGGFVTIYMDITERKAAADKIEHLAFYDPLTDLPNRRLVLDRLQHALTSSARHHRYGALMLLDMDDFKTLNDTLGHDVGDQFLVEVADRLQTCVREGDTVARHGGDEFVVILEDLNEDTLAAMQAESVAVKILRAVSQPYLLDVTVAEGAPSTHSYHCTSSIGITLFRDNSSSVDDLMKRADTAMYQAKASGRNSLRFFDPDMQAVVNARAALDNDLREAVREGQFCLYYQPQVNSAGSRTGAEALLRWRHPRRGMVSPAEFIPQAEATGLILPIGHWVMKTACDQLVAWAAQPELCHLTLAINVSARQFHHVDFVDQVLSMIDDTGADPNKLKLELTESLLLDDVEDIIAKMTELQAIGIGFALDDFGTGYSSLSYLKRLPLDQLKIDRSFVRDVLTDPNDATIARTIVALAHSMGLAAIAEGVETEAQHEFLAAIGCTAYQGYLFGRPMPIEDFSPPQAAC